MGTDHAHRHYGEEMLSVEEAQTHILKVMDVLETEEKPLIEAIGQVLAQAVVSGVDIPPLTNSAMDGYAVRYQDIAGASEGAPVSLVVIDEIAAGFLPSKAVTIGTASRIMTGAPIPDGADTVIPFEDTDEVDHIRTHESAVVPRYVSIRHGSPEGSSVRPFGQDLQKGELVYPAGTMIRAVDVGGLASLGLSSVPVVRRPVVSILSTGDELVLPGSVINKGQIYDANGAGLIAAVLASGGIPNFVGIAKDNVEDLNKKLDQCLESDLLLTSAGVSKGDFDVVKDVLSSRGKMGFWSVRMRPGKPLAFGTLYDEAGKAVPHLGLPGNPVSALVAFEIFVRPAIQKMLGFANLLRDTVEAVLEDPIENNDGRRVYARVIVRSTERGYVAAMTGNQGSNLLSSMIKSNGLAICPETKQVLQVGEKVRVHITDWDRIEQVSIR
jgi:molybdopterin molybdotransferase